jgi:hypothetical protein
MRGHRATAQPSEPSGGEHQCISIARALTNRPPVILADEPTAPLRQRTGPGRGARPEGGASRAASAAHETRPGRRPVCRRSTFRRPSRRPVAAGDGTGGHERVSIRPLVPTATLAADWFRWPAIATHYCQDAFPSRSRRHGRFSRTGGRLRRSSIHSHSIVAGGLLDTS